MAEFSDSLDDKQVAQLKASPVYFVATAPHAGRINLSPKGMDTLRVLSPTAVAYLDLTGSGNETAAHLVDDGRITLMVCSFTRAANILRLYGRGRSVQPGDGDWAEIAAYFELLPGTRQIFVLNIDSVQNSCGWGVPELAVVKPRATLVKHAVNEGEAELADYRHRNNRVSIDGLPTGLTNSSKG